LKVIRITCRIFGFLVSTPLTALIILCGLPFVRLAGGSVPRWRAVNFRIWSRFIVRLIGMKVEVHGTPPPSPFLLVCNHLSYVDIALLTAQTPCTFVARADLQQWPFLGPLIPIGGTLFLDRKLKRDIPRVIEQFKVPYEGGVGIVIFPEGTSSSGAELGRFRSSLLDPAAQGGFPVHYASVRYETAPGDPPASMAVSWWGDADFLKHLMGLFSLSSFQATLKFGSDPIICADRKELAARLEEKVRADFEPMELPEPAP
jgi:1-acyl-sn-glycerol-3-phosphate acyltransferase